MVAITLVGRKFRNVRCDQLLQNENKSKESIIISELHK